MKHLSTILAVTVVMLLQGCTTDIPTEQAYTQEQHDASTNVTLLPSDDMYISFERIVQLHKDMQVCLGLSIDPATEQTVIMFRSFEKADEWFTRDTGGANPSATEDGSWGGAFGLFMSAGANVKYIFINTDLDKEPYTSQGFDRNEYTDTQVVKHEIIHVINSYNGVSGHGDEFTRCDAMVEVRN